MKRIGRLQGTKQKREALLQFGKTDHECSGGTHNKNSQDFPSSVC